VYYCLCYYRSLLRIFGRLEENPRTLTLPIWIHGWQNPKIRGTNQIGGSLSQLISVFFIRSYGHHYVLSEMDQKLPASGLVPVHVPHQLHEWPQTRGIVLRLISETNAQELPSLNAN